MGISGSDKALMFSQFGVMRFGASRFGYHSPKVFVTVVGVHRAHGRDTPSEKLQDLSIYLANKDAPNRASFVAIGWRPVEGMEVIAQLGSKNRLRRLFGGTVLTATQAVVGLLPVFRAECVDWSWLLDEEPVYGHFTGSASDIALALMADAPSGFTTRQVEAGLPTLVGGITFTGVRRSAALRRLAKRAGARQFIDARKDLYFRVNQAHLTNPTNIVGGLDALKTFRFENDLSQIANRVPFQGGGTIALTEVAIGETILPLTDADLWWYGDGGVVVAGPQRIDYAGVDSGGAGALVGPGAAPSAPVSLAFAAGSGVDVGEHDYAVTFMTAAGESIASPIESIEIAETMAAPSGAPSTSPASTVASGISPGDHQWGVTFTNVGGETTISPLTAVVALDEVVVPTAPFVQDFQDEGDIETGKGYKYKLTYVTSGGETTGGSTSNNDVNVTTDNGGLRVSYDDDVSADPRVTHINIYRKKNEIFETFYLFVAQVENSSDASPYLDTLGDESLGGEIPSTDTASFSRVPLSNIAIGPSGTTSRKVYRKIGSAAAKLALTIDNNTATTANDDTPDASLGADAPSSNTATAQQVSVSSIPVGAAAVTDRKLYRTEADGSQLKLLATIEDNETTTYADSTADSSLGADVPTVDTSGLPQPEGQVAAGSTSLIVAGTSGFPASGWAIIGNGHQIIRYHSIEASALTGIPPSGPGSIRAAVGFNSTVTAAPQLLGIPASGPGSIRFTIPKGEAVNLLVTVEDTDAQAELQALLSADAPVVRESPPLSDQRVGRAEALNRATAFLALRARPGVRLGPYRTKDINTRVGLDVDINVTTPLALTGTFQIQSVTITNFTPNIMPDHLVTASNELFSLEAVLSKEP